MCRESPLFHHSVRLKRTDAVVGRSTLREKWWLLNIINRCQYYHVWADFHCRKYLQRKSEKGKIRIIFIKTEGSLPVTVCFLFLVSWWVSDSLRGRPVTAACNSSLFYYSSVHAHVWYKVCYTGIQIQTRGDLNASWVMFNGKCTIQLSMEVIYQFTISNLMKWVPITIYSTMNSEVWYTSTVEPRYFEVPREMEKKFEIAGLRNNRGSVKGKGKSKGIRSSFEIAGTSN